jgi:integrase
MAEAPNFCSLQRRGSELLLACCQGKTPTHFVFTRSDKGHGVVGERQIGNFRKLWNRVLREAGIERDILLHDHRRSAVRNMVRRGVPEAIAMRISGHKTRSVFDRYNIVSEADQLAAMRKIEAGKQAERELANQAIGPKSGQNAEHSIGNESQVAVN